MDLEALYSDKELDKKSKKVVLKTISGLQLFANIIDLYTIKSIETSVKFIELVTNDKDENSLNKES